MVNVLCCYLTFKLYLTAYLSYEICLFNDYFIRVLSTQSFESPIKNGFDLKNSILPVDIILNEGPSHDGVIKNNTGDIVPSVSFFSFLDMRFSLKPKLPKSRKNVLLKGSEVSVHLLLYSLN